MRRILFFLTVVLCLTVGMGGRRMYAAETAVVENGSEEVQNGLIKDENGVTRYYVDGIAQTGWQIISGKKYYFSSKGVMQTGWKKISGKKYYFSSKGVMQTGWKKISKKYYYFSASGKLQTNQIVGSQEDGYYYVDQTGVRVTDSRITAAVEFVVENSDSSQTRRQRLKACFQALCQYPYQGFSGDKPSASKIKTYAAYMFKNKKGNCFRYASAMAYIAAVLGFESQVAVGGVTAYANRSLSPYGWCEVKIGSTWRMIDCSMQRHHSDVSLYLVKRSKYPYRLRCDSVYTMTIQNGKVSWKFPAG